MVLRTLDFTKQNLWQIFWGVVWNASEFLKFPLGHLRPWIFKQMIGKEQVNIHIT